MQLGDIGYAGDDHVVPFQIEGLDVRGRVVQFGPVLERILTRHDYPEKVANLIAEAVVLASLLGTALKLEGRFVLQTRSDGPVNLLVADFSAPDGVRAYARYDAEAVAAAEGNLLGTGVLALTVDQGEHAKQYQGIVALDERGLEEAVREYFRQSEQIPTDVRLTVVRQTQPGQPAGWRAGGLLAQLLPQSSRRDEDAADEASEGNGAKPEDGWTETVALINTIDRFELADPTVGSERLLYRLFHERGVRVFDPTPIVDRCRCSREKAVAIVRSFSPEEVAEFSVDGMINVHCEFCSTDYDLDPEELDAETA